MRYPLAVCSGLGTLGRQNGVSWLASHVARPVLILPHGGIESSELENAAGEEEFVPFR